METKIIDWEISLEEGEVIPKTQRIATIECSDYLYFE